LSGYNFALSETSRLDHATAAIRREMLLGMTGRFAQIAAISAKVASWPDEGSEAASLFRGEMSDRPRVRQCPALI
jgi:hypothetical protein